MTDEQDDAVLAILQRIEADQAAMRRGLQRLLRRVAQIEERLDALDERLARLQHRVTRHRAPGR
jgi:hypothetical protein